MVLSLERKESREKVCDCVLEGRVAGVVLFEGLWEESIEMLDAFLVVCLVEMRHV